MALWTPLNDPNHIAFWHPKDAVLDAGVIASIPDLGPNGWDFVQATPSLRPTLTGEQIDFVVNSFLDSPALITGTNKLFGVLFVSPATQPGVIRRILSASMTAAVDFQATGGFFLGANTGQVNLYRVESSAPNYAVTQAAHVLIVDVSGTETRLWIDGVLVRTKTGTADLNTTAGLRVGEALHDGSWFLRGQVGPIAIIGASDTDSRQILEGYLAWQGGAETLLPELHPYRNAAPGSTTVTGGPITSGGVPAEYVALINVDSKAIYPATIDGAGNWSVTVPPGDYYRIAFLGSCRDMSELETITE